MVQNWLIQISWSISLRWFWLGHFSFKRSTYPSLVLVYSQSNPFPPNRPTLTLTPPSFQLIACAQCIGAHSQCWCSQTSVNSCSEQEPEVLDDGCFAPKGWMSAIVPPFPPLRSWGGGAPSLSFTHNKPFWTLLDILDSAQFQLWIVPSSDDCSS